MLKFSLKYWQTWAAWVAQQFSTAFSPGPDPGDPGSSPPRAHCMGLLLPLPVSLPLSLSLSLSGINKQSLFLKMLNDSHGRGTPSCYPDLNGNNVSILSTKLAKLF